MFETANQTNQRLYRAILDGQQYEKLIPKSYCKRLNGGKGNTEYSVNQMNKVVELYSYQTQKVAQKFKQNSLIIEAVLFCVKNYFITFKVSKSKMYQTLLVYLF